MASLDVTGLYYPPTLWPAVSTAVFARRNWADEWEWLPFISCTMATEAAGPSVTKATLQYDYGNIYRPEYGSFQPFYPYDLDGAYVLVIVFDWWGWATLWTGVADVCTYDMDANLLYAGGRQTWQCFGMEHVLDRGYVLGGYTTEAYTERPMTFNQRSQSGGEIIGNRVAEGFAFAEEGETWTHLDILKYLWAVINEFDSEGNPTAPIYFDFTGEGLYVLSQITEEVKLEGLSFWQAIDRIIDRKRGVGYRLVPDHTENMIWVYVYSNFAESIAFADLLIPAAAYQEIISFSGQRMQKPELTINRLSAYGRVVVNGGPVYSCFTAAYADATIVEGWAEELATAYAAGSSAEDATVDEHDAERATEKYRRVYTAHLLPDAWDWTVYDGEGGVTPQNAAPTVTLDGVVDPTLQSYNFRMGKRFERFLPVRAEGSTDQRPEYLKPLAIVKLPDEVIEEEEVAGAYALVDKLDALNLYPASVDVLDDDLGILVRPRLGHVFGLDTYDTETAADSNLEPQIDYRTLIMTVNVALDKRLQVVLPIPVTQTELSRAKIIDMPDAVAWWIAPGTVIDVEDGVLQRHEGGVVRDDGWRLRQMAIAAAAWFGRPRATLRWQTSTITLWYPVGMMIRALAGPEGYTDVGTSITETTYRFDGREQTTTSVTGYEELDFAAMAGDPR
jgi:hypothetical protein